MSLCCGDSPESWGLAGHRLRCHWPWSLAPGGALFSSTLSSAASGPSASASLREDRRASSPLTYSRAEGYDMGSLLGSLQEWGNASYAFRDIHLFTPIIFHCLHKGTLLI